jgi:zona occludens toxin
MSIELYTGFVGSGKSYCATKEAINIVDSKLGTRYVIANFPIKPKKKTLHFLHKNEEDKYHKLDRWIFKNNDELTVKYLIDKSLKMGWNKKEGSCLLIFDEASIPFNARTFHRSDRLEWIQFLTQSRKFGYDIIFITQDARMLDKQIRSLCEYEVVHKKLNNMFAFKWLNLLRISIFAQVKYWNGTNARYTRGQLKLVKYSSKVSERYDTLRLFDLKTNQ